MSGLRPGNYPEPPPADFANLGPPPGVKIRYFDSLDALGDFARANKIAANDSFNAHRYMGGYVPALQTVALPKPGILNDSELDQALYQHEVGGHSNDLVHGPEGTGWGWNAPDGTFHPVGSMADLTAAKAQYPQPASFDWSKAFATAPQTADPASSAVQLAKTLAPANDDAQDPAATPAGQ